jgi:PAS domain S-box-containing protein
VHLLPRRLYEQLVFIVSLIVIATIIFFGWFTGEKQSEHAMKSARQYVEAMGKNLAVSCAGPIISSDYSALETLLLRSAEFPDILEIQVSTARGDILSDIVHAPGSSPAVRFSMNALPVPNSAEHSIVIDGKKMIAWQPVIAGNLIGWVRIVRDMDVVYEFRNILWKNTTLAGALGILASFVLVLAALKRPIAALRRVTDFAKQLHDIRGAQLEVERSSAEIQELCESLNFASRELHANENALCAERERLSVTLQSIGDGVVAVDTEGKVVFLNSVAEALTGWTQAESAGRPLTEVFHIINEKTRLPVEDPVMTVLKLGVIVGLENHTVLIARNGEERSIADSAAPIKDREGKVIGVVLVFRDVTEKNRLEEDRLRARKLESIAVFAAGIAHDFNNILTAVLGNISCVTAKMDHADPAHERLAAAQKASVRAKNLTQQLLTFAKGGAPILKTAHIGDLVKDTIDFSLTGSNVNADLKIARDLWTAKIDGGQISQVIQNLIINAREAMRDGGVITITVDNFVSAKDDPASLPGDYVRIAVSDQGTGIPKEHLGMIYDPYFTTKEKGSGLGLATVYSIVKRHGGRITVESTVGSGSLFSVYLPALPGTKTDAHAGADGTSAVSPGSKKILVMDDEEDIRALACFALREAGHNVDIALDGREAVEIYRRALKSGQRYDAVIMDLTVPGGMGGKEAMKLLTALDPAVNAIVSSGYCNDPIMHDFRSFGFKGMVAKPYESDQLLAVVSSVLSGKTGRRNGP